MASPDESISCRVKVTYAHQNSKVYFGGVAIPSDHRARKSSTGYCCRSQKWSRTDAVGQSTPSKRRRMPIFTRSSAVLKERCVASRTCCEEFRAHRLAVLGVFHLQSARNCARVREPRASTTGANRSVRLCCPGSV